MWCYRVRPQRGQRTVCVYVCVCVFVQERAIWGCGTLTALMEGSFFSLFNTEQSELFARQDYIQSVSERKLMLYSGAWCRT